MTHSPTWMRAAIGCGLGMALAGCMTTTPVYDQHAGEAVRSLRAMQVLNPDASANTDTVAGIDGRAATAAMDRYSSSYRTPPSDPNSYEVGVGGSVTGTGTNR